MWLAAVLGASSTDVQAALVQGGIQADAWAPARAALRPDPRVEARITRLLAGMTLQQKVGQLIQVDLGNVTPDDLRHYPLGSIVNGGDSSPGGAELATPGEWLALADRFYDASIDPRVGPHPIPVLWAARAVHGVSEAVGATLFPQDIALGATRDPKLLQRIGAITAMEARTLGLDWALSPMLTLVPDPRSGRTYESYSERPSLVREDARAMILGLQGRPRTRHFLDQFHVIAIAAPWLGDGGGGMGGGEGSSQAQLSDVGDDGVAIGAGVQAMMAFLPSWQQRMRRQAAWVTGVLKQRMGFDGALIGDIRTPVPGCTESGCAAAINAGVDVLTVHGNWKMLYTRTLAQARSGQILSARLDDAVRRVLRMKLRAHLLEEGRPSSRPLAGHFELLGSPAHRAVARQAVRESLVLLKNSHHLLPLSPHEDVLVAGDGADNIPKQCGGWTLSWQGTGIMNRDFPHAESIYEGILDAVTAGGGRVEMNLAGRFERRPDVAIVVFGEDPYAGSQGDIDSLEYKPGEKSDLALLRILHVQGIPVVAVFLSGRPLWVNPEINASDAFVVAWLPGSEGEGIADVLFKTPRGQVRYDFHGKLPFSWPSSPQPGAPPLFPYGYGLTYADNGNLKPLPEDFDDPPPRPEAHRVLYAANRQPPRPVRE